MSLRQNRFPQTDPTPIFELFRGSFATELLTSAVAHFDLFGCLAAQPLNFPQLAQKLQLAERPLQVLLTALQAMQLIVRRGEQYQLTPLADEHLIAGRPFDVGNYLGLAAQSPGVLAMVERLRTNRPANIDNALGAAFIYRNGMCSAMEQAESARHFTLALSGRANNVAPYLAAQLDLGRQRKLLDVGGGTGIYSLELLKQNPHLQAVVMDRPEVLVVAKECAHDSGLESRLELVAGDMFADPLPLGTDVVLLSNILHDWDIPECQQLIARCAAVLPSGGRLCIHDVFLNDELDGPLSIALYSAALFTLTAGRAYSAAEYRSWMEACGLRVTPPVPTLIHCGFMVGEKI